MALPVPRTWTVGELLTAAKLNTDLRDMILYLMAPPRAKLYRTTSLVCATGSFITVGWDAEVVDSDNGHSTTTNNSRYIAQTAGWFDITANVNWNPESTAGFRLAMLDVNASGSPPYTDLSTPVSDSSCVLNPGGLMFLNVNDYVELRVLQNSGANRNLSGTSPDFTHLTLCWRSKQ